MLRAHSTDHRMATLQTTVCGECSPRTVMVVRDRTLACPLCGGSDGGIHAAVCLILGLSGTGKSALARELRAAVVRSHLRITVFDADILIHRLANGSQEWLNDWLLLARATAASGVTPILLLPCDERDVNDLPAMGQIPELRRAALICSSEVRRDRLRHRPSWRGWDQERIQAEVGRPKTSWPEGLLFLDSGREDPTELARRVIGWALPDSGPSASADDGQDVST
jgi:hypothetical protein